MVQPPRAAQDTGTRMRSHGCWLVERSEMAVFWMRIRGSQWLWRSFIKRQLGGLGQGEIVWRFGSKSKCRELPWMGDFLRVPSVFLS